MVSWIREFELAERSVALQHHKELNRRGRHWLVALAIRLKSNYAGLIGALFVVLVIAVAILAPLISPYAPNDSVAKRFTHPGARFWLGTDEFGRDLMSRIFYGARVALRVGVVSVAIALAIGASAGLIAGYFGGVIDNLIMRIADIMFSIPPLVLAIAIAAVLGPGINNVIIAIGIVYTPAFARIIRGPVLVTKETQYVDAARTIGAGSVRIIARHILPNVAAPLIIQATFSLSTAILTESSLSFVGLGVQPPNPSWGGMLNGSRTFMEQAWWLAVFPGAAIMIVVISFNMMGDGLRDILDPRLRTGGN